MEPSLTGNSSTPKPSLSSPTTLRAGLSMSNSSSTPTTPTSDHPKPKNTIPASSTTSSSSTVSPQTFPSLSSRSSSLSTLSSSPIRQPIRSLSQVGRSQLNAASTGIPLNPLTSASGAAAVAPKTPPSPEPGERHLVHCSFNPKTKSFPCRFFLFNKQCSQCLHDNCKHVPQHVKQPLPFYSLEEKGVSHPCLFTGQSNTSDVFICSTVSFFSHPILFLEIIHSASAKIPTL